MQFPQGFYTVYRTVRHYPRQIGGNLLGYVGEVTQEMLKRYTSYKAGDYVGISGVESAYESELKGRKGVKVLERDTHGAIKGSYMNGLYDSLPEPGRYLVSTIDARLQLLGRGADARQGRRGGGHRARDGEILMMSPRPPTTRRAGGPRARQSLYGDAPQQAAAALQPCREVPLSAGFDLQAGAGLSGFRRACCVLRTGTCAAAATRPGGSR